MLHKRIERFVALAATVGLFTVGVTACGSSTPVQTGTGKTLSFVLDTTANSKSLAEAITQNLSQFGMKVSIRQWQSTDLITAEKSGTRQAYMGNWGSAYFDPYDLTDPKLMTGARGNRSFYSNAQFDQLMTEAASTNNTSVRQQDDYKAQKILYHDAPWIFGYYLENVQIASSRLQGWVPYADGMEPMAKVSVNSGPNQVTVALPTNSIITLDPTASYSDRITEEVIQNIFDGLVTLSPGKTIEPELAISWQVNKAGTQYTFNLRHHVVFQNGQPFTSQDVLFTADKVLGEGPFQGKPSTRSALIEPPDNSLTVSAPSKYTVVFKFQKPFPVFLYGLMHMEIVPAQYYQHVGAQYFSNHPIGTGPFQYSSGSLSGTVVLTRFDHYWGGRPSLDKVMFQMLPDPESRVSALLSGSIDLATHLSPDQLTQFKNNSKFQLKSTLGTRAYYIELNNKMTPFNSLDVRQGLNYAVNWKQILQSLYAGYAHRMATSFLPSGFGFDSQINPYPYDPTKAVSLLKKAGYNVHVPSGS